MPRLTDAETTAITASVMLELAAGLTDAHTRYASGTTTYRHNNPDLAADSSDRRAPTYGTSNRERGGRLARFANAVTGTAVNRASAALPADNSAVVEGRSIFPRRVFGASDLQRVILSGDSNAKLGSWVTKGAWAGMPFYHLSLEERATCPRSCENWSTCYGNGMPSAVRVRYDVDLVDAVDRDLRHLNNRHLGGFVVRLHVLGDFPDLAYVSDWESWLRHIPALRVEGYTAHPRDSEIGRAIARLNHQYAGRWSVRNSVAPDEPWAPMQVTTLWDVTPERTSYDPATKTVVCPQELGKTQTCGTCSLCWKQELRHVRIAFLGHGGRGKRS